MKYNLFSLFIYFYYCLLNTSKLKKNYIIKSFNNIVYIYLIYIYIIL